MIDDIPTDVLARVVTIAMGRNREDKQWKNATGPFGGLAPLLLGFERGDKDGKCIIQGKLVDGVTQRQAKDVLSCDIIMFDHDTGETIDEIDAKITAAGLFAILWTTYSHMKTTTEITEAKLVLYRKQNKLDADVSDVDVARAYLREFKNVQPWVLDSITHVERAHQQGGVKFTVHHAPMPRVRSLFVLDKPYVFAERGSSQQDAIQEWKELYAGMSGKLGLTFDRSCVDPSRLMYLPRIAKDADITQHAIYVIPGAMVDIDTMPRAGRAETQDDPFVAMGKQKVQTATPGLMKFVAEHALDFAAADWLRAIAPEDVRRENGEKIDFCCPNEDGHSVVLADDTSFMASNGDGASGFWLGCHHDTCKGASGDDRVWYLDRLCQKYEQKVEDLLLYCPEYETRREEEQKQENKAEENTAEQVQSLTPDSTPEQIEAALDAIAARKLSTVGLAAMLRTVCEKVGEKYTTRNQIKWEKFYKERLALVAPADEGTVAEFAPVPANGASCTHIWAHWPASEAGRILTERLTAVNAADPTLFRMTSDGTAVRLHHEGGVAKLEPLATREQWSVEIGRRVKFARWNEEKNQETEIHPPDWAVTFMRGGGGYGAMLPLERIIKVPVFSAEGELLTTPGYHPSIQMYLDPPIEFDWVPPVGEVTWDQVNWAREEIFEVLRDFPFSDAFDGNETLPVRDNVRVDDFGRPLPTWGRGRSSYAHTVAMMIQPFVKKMIPGNFPMYFVDKSVPGTGAGLLMDVISYVFTGVTAPVQTLQKGNNADDEFRKRVTAMLRSNADIMFFDNVNHDVDSATLAAALTAGFWTDRVLGTSETVELPINCVWAIAGNNVGFAGELVRRLVPIRMDAEVPDPARDRPPTWYTHGDLIGSGYLAEHRSDLVQAVHIIVQWWIQNGKIQCADEVLQSFGGWSGVLGGILRDAGIEGFLGARELFTEARNAQTGTANLIVGELYAKFGNEVFLVSEAVMELNNENPLTRVCVLDDVEQIARFRGDDNLLRAAFGRWMKKEAVGKTFRFLREDGQPIYVKPVSVKRSTGNGYKLAPVAIAGV